MNGLRKRFGLNGQKRISGATLRKHGVRGLVLKYFDSRIDEPVADNVFYRVDQIEWLVVGGKHFERYIRVI